MNAILFDTLRLSRILRDKGHFTPEQAEALAEALGEASQDNLATKLDIASLKTDIANARTEISTSKIDIIKWTFGAIGFQTVVIVGAAVTLARIFVK